MLILWVCVAIAVAVFGVMIYRSRRSGNRKARAGHFRSQHHAEVHLDADPGR
jgi:hypothetical protein